MGILPTLKCFSLSLATMLLHCPCSFPVSLSIFIFSISLYSTFSTCPLNVNIYQGCLIQLSFPNLRGKKKEKKRCSESRRGTVREREEGWREHQKGLKGRIDMTKAWCVQVWKRHREAYKFAQLVCINNYNKNKCPSFRLLYCAFSFSVSAVTFSCLFRIITLKPSKILPNAALSFSKTSPNLSFSQVLSVVPLHVWSCHVHCYYSILKTSLFTLLSPRCCQSFLP